MSLRKFLLGSGSAVIFPSAAHSYDWHSEANNGYHFKRAAPPSSPGGMMTNKVVDFITQRDAFSRLRALSSGKIIDPRLKQAYSDGVVVGDYAGKQFRAECPLGDHVAAKKYTADLRWALSEMVDKYRAEGENDNWLAAWAGGVVTALVPHAIAWNYG